MAVPGCFYLEPINRRPKAVTVERWCEPLDARDIDPTAVCNQDVQAQAHLEQTAPCNFEDLHHNECVWVKATFNDPDGEEKNGTFHWRISACDDTTTKCDLERLYLGDVKVAAFKAPRTLKDTGTPGETGLPVQRVIVEVDVFDERGASSSAEAPPLHVLDGPTLALRSSPGVYQVGTPIDMFATYGDPDDDLQGTGPTGVTLEWTLRTPSGQPPPMLIDLAVPPDPGDPAHVTVGKRLVPSEAGPWEVRVTATNARSRTNERRLELTVDPASSAMAAVGRVRSWE